MDQANGQDGEQFRHATQNSAEFKTKNIVCFWNFPFNIFTLELTAGNQNHIKENRRRGVLLRLWWMWQARRAARALTGKGPSERSRASSTLWLNRDWKKWVNKSKGSQGGRGNWHLRNYKVKAKIQRSC